jgi:hypothetical protein
MSVTNKSVRSDRTNKRNSLNEIFSYFRWKSFIREMKKKEMENRL